MTYDEVVDVFCNYTGIEREQLFSYNRTAKVRRGRHMLYLILRLKCGESSYTLAKKFNRTRRNIVRGISSTRDAMSIYKDVRREYEEIIKRIEDGE